MCLFALLRQAAVRLSHKIELIVEKEEEETWAKRGSS
jgi:hypothetical protein